MLGLAVLFLITRPVALYVVDHLIHKAQQQGNCPANFNYINDDSVCNAPVISKSGYATEQQKLTDYLISQKSGGELTDYSVYFRDLKAGPVWGINEMEAFAPASSLKLPLAMLYLNLADDDESVLDQKLSYAPNPPWNGFDPHFRPSQIIQPNTEYTVDELLQRMLKYSDNNAYGLLQSNLINTGRTQLMTDTFLQLGIITPKDEYDKVINVRRYASLFTILYNSSFLNPVHSEAILKWMVGSDFQLGIKAGVPDQIDVANKFGERVLPDGTKQLSDCGIVYYPNNPYVICTMMRGTDYAVLSQVIAHVSDDVYREVDSRKLK